MPPEVDLPTRTVASVASRPFAERDLDPLRRQLEQTFGSPFVFCIRDQADESWKRWPHETPSGWPIADEDLPRLAEQAVEAAGAGVVSTEAGNCCVALLCEQSRRRTVVALGAVETTPSSLLLGNLAAATLDRFQQGRQAERHGEEAEEYARQISNDFAEIDFLLNLSRQLELCDVQRSVRSVAQSILPVLEDLVGAEAVALIFSNGEDSCLAGVEDVSTIWGGQQLISESECRQIIGQFRSEVARQPVIRNRLSAASDFSHHPTLNSLLLMELGTNGSLGWILALNRKALEEGRDTSAPTPVYGLGDDEFGTVEAGLVEAASAMLVTHERNLASVRERESLLIGALRALVNAVDAKDAYTCGHSDRVALIAKRLGVELGLDDGSCERLYLAGLLHDIGKIGIADDVLLKPGKLTDTEFSQIQSHPQRGHAIVKHLPQLRDVVPAVLHHHERWDGRGYPAKLTKEETPLFARIVGVADAFDAMSSCRPYRETMPEEKVASIMKAGAGTQWDPAVIESLFNAIFDIREICRDSRTHTDAILGLGQLDGTDVAGGHSDSLSSAVRTMQTR